MWGLGPLQAALLTVFSGGLALLYFWGLAEAPGWLPAQARRTEDDPARPKP